MFEYGGGEFKLSSPDPAASPMPTTVSLSETMRRLLTGYAVYFNRKYQRTGHLFQNRYKSILCKDEPYLLELVRYIHLNPLRSGMVSDLEALERYPWSGHAVLLGHHNLEGQETGEMLAHFGKGRTRALRGYRQFVADGVAIGHRDDLTGGGLKRSMHGNEDQREIARARAIFCCLAVHEYGYTAREAGQAAGLGSAGASIAVKRGREVLRGDPALRDRVIEKTS